MGAASSPRAFMRSARIGVNSAYDDIGNQSAFGDVVQVGAAKTRASNAALQAPDLTDQIIKSVAAAELKRKKVGATRESMFVSERPSPAQMDADRKKNPALNQYTPKPKPPGGA